MTGIAITRTLSIDPREVVPAHIPVEVFALDRPPSADELAAIARDASVLVSLVSDRIDRALLERLPSLRAITQMAVGYDNIDLVAARERGLVTTHTPDTLTESTAELAVALLLGIARRFPEGEAMMRARAFAGWAPTMLLGTELVGKTVGVVGAGRIGRAFLTRMLAFDVEVLVSARDDRHLDGLPPRTRQVPLDALLRESDFVSLHAPGSHANHHLLDARALASMKPGAYLINTARGTLVDEAALVRALASGHLRGAALDVYEHEPAVHPGLFELPNVLLLPHLGSATDEARRRMATMALRDAVRVIEGRPPLHPIPSR